MFKKQDYYNDFLTRIVNFEPKQQFFLTSVFKEMFATIEPAYEVDGVAFYKNINLNSMIQINGKNVSFMGYNDTNGMKKKVVNFASNGKIYVNSYELEPNGVFRKDVRRFPMEYDNIQRQAIEYIGHMDNAQNILGSHSWISSFDKIIDQSTIQGIANGKPVCMYSSHSYVTIGKTNKGHFTYGVFNKTKVGDLDFVPFKMYEDDVITADDARELNDILYNGRVPSDKVISDTKPIYSQMGE